MAEKYVDNSISWDKMTRKWDKTSGFGFGTAFGTALAKAKVQAMLKASLQKEV